MRVAATRIGADGAGDGVSGTGIVAIMSWSGAPVIRRSAGSCPALERTRGVERIDFGIGEDAAADDEAQSLGALE